MIEREREKTSKTRAGVYTSREGRQRYVSEAKETNHLKFWTVKPIRE